MVEQYLFVYKISCYVLRMKQFISYLYYMDPNELEKLDRIPTSDRHWVFRTPFYGIIMFIIVLVLMFIKNWLMK